MSVVESYLTTAEAARELGLTPMRVRQLISTGRLRGHKAGPRALLIHRADLESYKQTPKHKPGPKPQS